MLVLSIILLIWDITSKKSDVSIGSVFILRLIIYATIITKDKPGQISATVPDISPQGWPVSMSAINFILEHLVILIGKNYVVLLFHDIKDKEIMSANRITKLS